MLNSRWGERDFGVAPRRDVLKSALLTALCAGLSPAATEKNPSVGGTSSPVATSHAKTRRSGPLSERMVAFMLAHEQFTVPELIRLGAAAEKAGFDLLATSDHFQPWQANERHAGQAWVTLGALGSTLGVFGWVRRSRVRHCAITPQSSLRRSQP
jgi:hypothetical protein